MKIKVLLDDKGEILLVYLIFVGFDYFGIGLEYVYLDEIKCVIYFGVIDEEVV